MVSSFSLGLSWLEDEVEGDGDGDGDVRVVHGNQKRGKDEVWRWLFIKVF